MQSCVKDEGRPLGIGFQEQVSNQLQAAAVKSRGRERWSKRSGQDPGQVRVRETNESEPTDDASLSMEIVVKTRGVSSSGISPPGA